MENMSLYTLLKCSKAVFEKKLEEKPKGGINVTVFGKKQPYTYAEILEQIDKYSAEADSMQRVCSLHNGAQPTPKFQLIDPTHISTEYDSLTFKELYQKCVDRGLTNLKKTKDTKYYIDLLVDTDLPF